MQEGNSYINPDSIKMSIETTFQLKRSGVSSTCVSVEVDFSPLIQKLDINQQNPDQKNLLRSIPIFNKDKNFFTPSFILQMDKNKYIQNQHIYHSLFDKKVEQMDEQKSEMYLPRPSKTNSFCCVCKSFFQDYLTHVNLPMHKTLMEKSQFHAYIQQICNKFTLKDSLILQKRGKQKVEKNKRIKKERKSIKQTKFMNSPVTQIQNNQFIGQTVQIY